MYYLLVRSAFLSNEVDSKTIDPVVSHVYETILIILLAVQYILRKFLISFIIIVDNIISIEHVSA